MIVTTPTIAGYRIVETKGEVFGIVVRRMTEYAEMLEESRQDAINRMVAKAQRLGANAIVSMRFDSTEIGAITPIPEIVAYGTAVVVVPGDEPAGRE